ncbi:transcriptional regulator [Streptomyces inusitatus]|uniref:Transcriptional regulator n=1 Tax=Streptomyces inusitatus TaxID=68221 RepID=A0A918PWG1_9ACTN|nr:winged helix-turn-helix domain-containing protein [Streptomyces inusitatus]GGZ25121.1 transcriptional regulator [Streptomyces inusitatus]
MVRVGRAQGGAVEIEFTAEDMARTRFAVSPLWEVVASVRVLMETDDQGMHRQWCEQVRPLLAAAKLDLTPLARLITTPVESIPSFLVPPPTTPQPSLEVELATLRATPPELLRTSCPGAQEYAAELRSDPVRELGRLTELIAAYWEIAIAPYWPRMLALFEGDILHRAIHFAEGGARRLFDDFGPQLRWDSGTLQRVRRASRATQRLGGRGLLLVPSAFAWPQIFSNLGREDWQPTLRYPPRGIGALWKLSPQPCSDALAGVLGRTRARLLAELTAPASTTDLARRISLSAGGVSQHLTALRAAGLVSAHRTGRVVLYARTSVGEALVR